MDFREARQNGTCKASYLNSPRRATRINTMQVAEANCKLTISGPQSEKRLRLVATRLIPRMTEVL